MLAPRKLIFGDVMCQFVHCPPPPGGWIFYDYRKAGAVAMYCRLQGYPAPRLISYRIAPGDPTTTGRVPLV